MGRSTHLGVQQAASPFVDLKSMLDEITFRRQQNERFVSDGVDELFAPGSGGGRPADAEQAEIAGKKFFSRAGGKRSRPKSPAKKSSRVRAAREKTLSDWRARSMRMAFF